MITSHTGNKYPFSFWAIIAFIAMLLWMLFSCSPTQRAFDRVSRPENDGKLSTLCADKYPVKDSVIVRDSVSFDTIYVGSDPVFDTVRIGDTVVVTKTLPVEKIVTKTVTQVKEVYRENTARVRSLGNQLEAVTSNLNKKGAEVEKWKDLAKHYKGQRNRAYAWWVIVVALCSVYLFRKQLFGIVKNFI